MNKLEINFQIFVVVCTCCFVFLEQVQILQQKYKRAGL